MLVHDVEVLTFRHELARIAIEQTVTPGELADLHAAALRALRASNRGDDRRLAHHAAGCGDRAAVLEHATRAAQYAARVGAHREAAAQFRLALWNGDPDERVRFELVVALSYECYLAGEPDAAHDLRLEAMQLAEQVGDVVSVGVNQRWLSRLSWFRGRNDDAERWATRAIATLEPLGESAELAMAYSNFAQLRMLASEPAFAVAWGERAIAMARAVGAREVEIHALNNVGTAHGGGADPALGEQLLRQSLEMALEDDAHEHAARAYTNLGTHLVAERRYDQAERYLRAGIAYCTDRDLDAWRLYMGAWLARINLERGRVAAAGSLAAEVLRHRNLAPVTRVAASVVAAQAALRAGRPGEQLLDTALQLAEGTGEVQRLSPVAVARAEAAWLADRPDEIVVEVDRAWSVTVDHPHKWELGELSWWLFLVGIRRETPVDVAEPFAAMLAEEWIRAAELWEKVGSPLWQAHALARSPNIENARTALEMLDALDVPAVRSAILRDRQAAGLPVPRGPRASSRANAWGLTPREIEILELLTDGLSNAELARQLYLSEKTVGHHVSAILRKLGEPTRSRAVAAARRHGIVEQT
jgi:DNA-binding CsgD family transcriptional regulator/tetratricopeptide (TPR) repeat protein